MNLSKTLRCTRRSQHSVAYFSTKADASKNKFSTHQYCINLVRSHDYENYLPTLLIKGPVERQGAFAIRAFNVEIAKVAGAPLVTTIYFTTTSSDQNNLQSSVEQVSDEKIGQMRLKFWHDAINQIFDKNREKLLPEHPVLLELNYIIKKYNLTKPYFQRLIQARQRPSNFMFTTSEELEQYVETSTSSAYYLMLKIVGINDLNVDHAASHLGKAQGICNMLRTLAVSSSNKHIRHSGLAAIPPIPQEILLQHGCSYERVLRQQPEDVAVQNCTFDVASIANIHLEKARKMNDKVPKAAKKIFLPATAVDRFLTRLRLANFKLTDSKVMRRDGLLPLAYYWNNFRRRY